MSRNWNRSKQVHGPHRVLREADEIEADDEYDIKVKGSTLRRGRVLYHIKWLGFPRKKRTGRSSHMKTFPWEAGRSSGSFTKTTRTPHATTASRRNLQPKAEWPTSGWRQSPRTPAANFFSNGRRRFHPSKRGSPRHGLCSSNGVGTTGSIEPSARKVPRVHCHNDLGSRLSPPETRWLTPSIWTTPC